MSKQQSAVEWFINELESKGEAWENVSTRRLQINIDVTKYLDLKRQVKEIEKVNMIGLLKWMNKIASETPMRLETDLDDIVEQYYNETYKNK
jgi:hypothetical protein